MVIDKGQEVTIDDGTEKLTLQETGPGSGHFRFVSENRNKTRDVLEFESSALAAAEGVSQENLRSERLEDLEKAKPLIDRLGAALEKDAQEKGTENTIIHKKRKGALEEARTIVEGVADPNEVIPQLRSDEIFISYSRRNEATANLVHLALRSSGMSVRFDNQETNVMAGQRQPSPALSNERAIGMATEWKPAINANIPDGGYTMLVLTPDVLDKFDVIGGQEVVGAIKKDNRLIVAIPDGADRGPVLDRLEELARRGGQYKEAARHILQAQKISISQEQLSGSHRDRGDYLLGEMAREEKIKVKEKPKSGHRRRKPASAAAKGRPDSEAASGALDTITRLKGTLNNERPKTLKESRILRNRKRALEESKILIRATAQPETLINELDRKSFVIPGGLDALKDDSLEKLGQSFQDLGLEKSQHGSENDYLIVPLTSELLEAQNRESGSSLDRIGSLRESPLLGLSFDDRVFPALERMKDSRSSYSSLFADRFLSTQVLQLSRDDLKDPRSLAAYVLMKEALTEFAHRRAARKDKSQTAVNHQSRPLSSHRPADDVPRSRSEDMWGDNERGI